jgi:hypothetical protein
MSALEEITNTSTPCKTALKPKAKTGMTPLKYAVFGEVDDDEDSDYDPTKDTTDVSFSRL